MIAIRNGAAAYVSKDRLFKLGPSIATVLSTAGEPTELTFRLLFQSSPDSYLVVTTALRIVAVTDSYCKATMIRREEILGRHLFDVFPDNPHTAGANDLRASLERVIDHGAPDSVELMRYDTRRPEDERAGEHSWKAMNYPVFDASGDLAYIIHRVEDILEKS